MTGRPRPFAHVRILVGVVLLGALTATSCTDFGFQAEITNRAPLDPLPEYAAWWSATEACGGASGTLDRVEWYLATSIVVDGALAFGAWTPPHEIVLVSGYEDDEVIVRHEMLHDLLGETPSTVPTRGRAVI